MSGEEEDGRREEKEKEKERPADIKSDNPHLTGREILIGMVLFPSWKLTPF